QAHECARPRAQQRRSCPQHCCARGRTHSKHWRIRFMENLLFLCTSNGIMNRFEFSDFLLLNLFSPRGRAVAAGRISDLLLPVHAEVLHVAFAAPPCISIVFPVSPRYMSVVSDANPGSLRPNPHVFATTHWSVVLSAGQTRNPQSDEALTRLCET